MNQNSNIEETLLWLETTKLQNQLIKQHSFGLKKQQIEYFISMMPLFRKLHWTAAFLGLKDIADIACGGAVFITRIHDSSHEWSEDYSIMLQDILDCITALISSCDYQMQEEEDNAQDSRETANRIEQIKSYFHLKQINIDSISPCFQLTIDQIPPGDTIQLPPSVVKCHRLDCTLTVIHLNLAEQNKDASTLSQQFEEEIKNGRLLLHGPLTVANHGIDKELLPYFLVLDTEKSGKEWLEDSSLNGKVLCVPAQPVKKKRVVNTTTKLPDVQPAPLKTQILNKNQTPHNSISFDSEFVKDLEPVVKKSKKNNKRRRISNRDLKIQLTVGAKLQVIVSSIIIIAMLSLSFTSLFFFRSEITDRIVDTNITLSNLVAKQAEGMLIELFNSGNLLFQLGTSANGSELLIDDFFTNLPSLVYVGIPGSGYDFFNRDWLRSNRIIDENAILRSIIESRGEEINRAKTGETIILNVSPIIPNVGTPILALAASFLLGTQEEALLILVDIGGGMAEHIKLQEGITTTIIVNANGEILDHPDNTRIFGGENIKDSPIFASVYAQGTSKGQIRYKEESDGKEEYILGSFTMIPVGNLGVVSTVKEKDAFKAVNRIRILNFSLLGSILSLSILGVFFFGQNISIPLKELALATRQIKARNYDISIKPRTSDEVGQLTRHFLGMIPELETLDRLQERVSKFVNPQVMQMISNNSLPEHADTKDITVFFSDIRNFTLMSEQMHDPQLVLDNLSDYFRTVVPCIELTHGTVDKFIGDAIMAVWGSMKELPNHAESAIEAALNIRKVLLEFNAVRGSIMQPKIQVGCGINSGLATIGMMGGGSAKEEWAHMGDTINFASRIEELNKPMGTDILISTSTYEKVRGIYDVMPMKRILVKGKVKPQKIYAVLGRFDDNSRPRDLTQLRELLGIKGDFDQDTNKKDENHEEKFKILDS